VVSAISWSKASGEAKAAAKALMEIQSFIFTIIDMNTLVATITEEQSLTGQEISQRVVVISEQSLQSAELDNDNC